MIGLGYVGLPVAVAFAERFPNTVGFDVDHTRVDELNTGIDRTREVDTDRLRNSSLVASAEVSDLEGVDFFIVTVPTPIDGQNRPDLSAIKAASRTVGAALRPGAVVVYESTVYPGVTEEICGPILEETSGLRCGTDFKLAYSPERINPGDHDHRFESIAKVVSGQDDETLALVADMYGKVINAEIHRAPTIAVAEAAKVIENTQRDLNIALINELATIFDRLGVDTNAVLDAAATKWNFNRFTPGLVGGHCIGVDPYYLTARAEQVGVQPQVILAGRRTNNGMGEFVADTTIKHLARSGADMSDCRVLVVGIAFKENVPDFRNTGVVSVVKHLAEYGIDVTVWDPVCDAGAVKAAYGFDIGDPGDPASYSAIILAVPHSDVIDMVASWVKEHGPRVLIDVKGAIDPATLPSTVVYWRL
ncbi:MAG: nucleotide sugar dehydrogenase [Acidimicrobiia bacterium]|nr:MAG: nucleotide sugar dehydrogenase [Acidimicrobiia bacterium]